MKSNKQKIVLYNPSPLSKHRLSVQAPIALLAISKILDKENYEIKIVSNCLYSDPIPRLVDECEDALCLGITCMTGYQITDGLYVTNLIRSKYPKLPIIWGGWHPSMEPGQTIESPCGDIIVRGQGERTFAEIVHCLSEGKPLTNISGISYKEDGKIYHNPERPYENINNFPNLPFHLIDVKRCLYTTEYGSRTINYVSSYGCPFRCRFCEEQVVSKRKWTGLDAKRIVDDIEWLVNNYQIDSIAFHDSNFFVDKKRVREFCEELIKRDLKIKWGNANGRTKQLLLYEDDLWDLIQRSGLSLILTGAESGWQEALDFIDKDCTVEETIGLAKKCKEHNVRVIFSFLVGLPWSPNIEETRKKIEIEYKLTLKLIDELIKIDPRNRIILSHYTPYPGSPMYYRSIECGFRPPSNFADWGHFLLEKGSTPWMDNKLSKRIEQLTTYIFFFACSESYGWMTSRMRNRFLRFLFKGTFKVFERIANFRWKHKFFALPIDYMLYRFARDHSKVFGLYQS